MSGAYYAGRFVVCFPIWAILHNLPDAVGFFEGVHPDGEKAVVLFGNNETAADELLVRVAPSPEFVVTKVAADPAELLGFLDSLEILGKIHVAFDPTKGTANTLFTIAGLRKYVLEWTA